MKTATISSRIRLTLGTFLFLLAASLLLTGCGTGGDSSNNADHSQHQHSDHNM